MLASAVLTPVLAWLLPRDFWIAPTLVGLFGLPAARLREQDRPLAIILFSALIWAAVSTSWSPFHPSKADETTILKMAFELPLYGCAVLAVRRADPALLRRALQILAWGCTLYGLILLGEAFTHGTLYKGLRYFYSPMRDDLAESKIGHSTYVLGVLWPVAALGASPKFRPWLALAMAAGVGAAAKAFSSDAPLLGLVVGPVAGLMVWLWPRLGPKALAAVAAAIFLSMPAAVWSIRHYLNWGALEAALPKSDSMRMDYWSHAIDWIWMRPLRGWGLDASRSFGPGIKLHPHNQPLQVWMELGVIGAILAAAFWGVAFAGLSRPRRDLTAAAAAASAAVYILFGVNFGVWQEWWLGLGAMVALLMTANVTVQEAE